MTSAVSEAVQTPSEYQRVQRSDGAATETRARVSIQVPAGVMAFQEAISWRNGAAVSWTGPVASAVSVEGSSVRAPSSSSVAPDRSQAANADSEAR